MNSITSVSVGLNERKGLRREQAAIYVGFSPTIFDEMVGDGRMPGAKLVNSCPVWDRVALEAAFEALPDRNQKLKRRWGAPNANQVT